MFHAPRKDHGWLVAVGQEASGQLMFLPTLKYITSESQAFSRPSPGWSLQRIQYFWISNFVPGWEDERMFIPHSQPSLKDDFFCNEQLLEEYQLGESEKSS